MPIELTDEMMDAVNNALNDRLPCIVATASPTGTPDVSYRGSVMAFDRQHLAFWERVKGETLANVEANPGVCVFYRNPQTRKGWRFYGTATVLRDGDLREKISRGFTPPRSDRIRGESVLRSISGWIACVRAARPSWSGIPERTKGEHPAWEPGEECVEGDPEGDSGFHERETPARNSAISE